MEKILAVEVAQLAEGSALAGSDDDMIEHLNLELLAGANGLRRGSNAGWVGVEDHDCGGGNHGNAENLAWAHKNGVEPKLHPYDAQRVPRRKCDKLLDFLLLNTHGRDPTGINIFC